MQEQPPSDPPRREPAAQTRRSRSTKPTFTPPPAPEPARADVAGDTPPRPRRAKVAPTVLFQPPDPAQATPSVAEVPATPRPRPSAGVTAGTDPGTPAGPPPPATLAADEPVIGEPLVDEPVPEEAPKRPRRAPAAKKAAATKKATSAARKSTTAPEAPAARKIATPGMATPEIATPEALPAAGIKHPETTAPEIAASHITAPGIAAPAEDGAPRTPAPQPSPRTPAPQPPSPESAGAPAEAVEATLAGRARKSPKAPAKKATPTKRTPARRPSAAQRPAAPTATEAPTERAPAEPTPAQPPTEPVTDQAGQRDPQAQAKAEPTATRTAVGQVIPVEPAQVTPEPEAHDAGPGWRAVGVRVLDHPGFAPELLALAAVDALGPRAADWVQRTRDAYPDADADGLARLVTRRFVRLAGTGGALAAGAGLFAPVAELSAVLWTQANLVLHLATVYGRDPAHPDRVAELLVLTQVHPDGGTARAALDAARSAGAPAEGSWSRAAEAAWRLATPLAAQAVGWLGLRLAARLLPGAAALAAATGDRASTERLAARAITLYRPPRR
ncbi:hypothetical protein [Micromonospora chersina]|uniref:EcsC protein family protein n=1 Tax=Micromonospora chersina TaxID=47854 RepID=A0A1C6VJ55_9ACTN|nr:hypothetical protein [Micromonospora chersina]SCL66312.1 hypothetical protein GA0070603_4160 [Micromonospora chersina]